MNNFFNAIGSFFSKILNSKPVVTLESWFKQLLQAEAANIWQQLLGLAISEVSVLMTNTTLTGTDKKQQAYNNIVNAAKNAGVQAATSDINLAIELALSGLKSAQGNGGVVDSGISINGKPIPASTVGN